MPNISITPAAEDDLINIWIYIARDNPKAADRTFQAAEETFEPGRVGKSAALLTMERSRTRSSLSL